jgi:NADPH:quinone reductase-like Zn-dependent oxidoreductase
VGRDLTGVRVGDRVMALVNGGLSQEVVVDAALTVPIPRGWSYAEGAAGILGLLTETETADVVAALRAETDLGNEALRPTIDQVVSWTEAEHAQELLAENSHLGKIVLVVGTAT